MAFCTEKDMLIRSSICSSDSVECLGLSMADMQASTLGPMRSCRLAVRERGAHLCRLELQRESVVHQTFKLLKVVIVVLAPSFALNLFQLFLVDQVALYRDMTRVQD